MPLDQPALLSAPESALLLEILLGASGFVLLSVVGFVVAAGSVSLLMISRGDETLRQAGLVLLARTELHPAVACLLPVVAAIGVSSARLLYDPRLLGPAVWGGFLLLLFAGLTVLSFCRRRVLLRGMVATAEALAAAAAAATIVLGVFLLVCAADMLIVPEEWPFVAGSQLLLLSWHGVAVFFQFVTLSLALTGAVLRRLAAAPETAERLRPAHTLGTALLAVALLLWPLPLLFDLLTLPSLARSAGIYLLAVFGLVAALAVCLQLPAPSSGERKRCGIAVSVALGLFLLQILSAHVARGNVLTEPVLRARLLEITPVSAAKKAETPPTSEEGPVAAAGREVFEQHCVACHRFDRRIVGPPLNAVVPVYRGDMDALKNFIRDPVKKNPDYPAMPKLALTEEEIAAVAAYLFEQTSSETADRVE